MFESSDKFRRIALRSAVKGVFFTIILPVVATIPLYLRLNQGVHAMGIPIGPVMSDIIFVACLLASLLFVLYLYKMRAKTYYSPMYAPGPSFEITFEKHIIAKSTVLYVGAMAIALLSIPNYFLSHGSSRNFIFLLLPIITFFLIRPSRDLIEKVYTAQQKMME